MTKTFAVIGDPIEHSLSPAIHNAAFKDLSMDCTYIAYRIPSGELMEGVESLRQIRISGFNVTIPHKIEMMQYLDVVTKECEMIGATNTVSNEDGRFVGYNTDMDGFLDPIHRRKIQVAGKNVLLIGAGGAARAIAAGFVKDGIKHITIANRTRRRGEEVAEFCSRIGIDADCVTLEEAGEVAGSYQFIVNATSVGLKNESSPISTKTINKDCIVYDIVYMPMNTDLIAKSKEKSATVIYGYEMLLGQAAIAFKIWHGIDAPYEAMKKVLLGGF